MGTPVKFDGFIARAAQGLAMKAAHCANVPSTFPPAFRYVTAETPGGPAKSPPVSTFERKFLIARETFASLVRHMA
jgi:hypothetical protein